MSKHDEAGPRARSARVSYTSQIYCSSNQIAERHGNVITTSGNVIAFTRTATLGYHGLKEEELNVANYLAAGV